MNTLILSPRHSSDSQALWQACIKTNEWNTHRAYRYNTNHGSGDPCVYGEMQFCDIVAERLGLGLIEPPNDFLPELPRQYTKRSIDIVPHKKLKNINRRAFYKPANDKVFHHGVYEKGSDVPSKYIDEDCPVLISDVVNFTHEFRCYVLDRKVITYSIYEWPGSFYNPSDVLSLHNSGSRDDALKFAEDVVKDSKVKIPSALAVDVGLTEDNKWMVIEANQVYASGIYHEADANKILPIIKRSSGLMSKVSDSDRKYLRNS